MKVEWVESADLVDFTKDTSYNGRQELQTLAV